MKAFLILGLIFSLVFGNKSSNEFSKPAKKEFARCVGAKPCNACSTCSSCQWCNAGGTCGICASVKTTDTIRTLKAAPKTQAVYSGQCRATTKKGTRCSRSAKSNGYCWQHGGS